MVFQTIDRSSPPSVSEWLTRSSSTVFKQSIRHCSTRGEYSWDEVRTSGAIRWWEKRHVSHRVNHRWITSIVSRTSFPNVLCVASRPSLFTFSCRQMSKASTIPSSSHDEISLSWSNDQRCSWPLENFRWFSTLLMSLLFWFHQAKDIDHFPFRFRIESQWSCHHGRRTIDDNHQNPDSKFSSFDHSNHWSTDDWTKNSPNTKQVGNDQRERETSGEEEVQWRVQRWSVGDWLDRSPWRKLCLSCPSMAQRKNDSLD